MPEKIIEQQKVIEQLWFTWSDVGIDTTRSGYRIRAASPGLQDVRSGWVQSLEAYLVYALPSEADRFEIPAKLAPLCLTFAMTPHGRVLVHKAYRTQDGIGRYGSYFIHLLSGLESNFSARDAIMLWRSPFWKTTDEKFDHDSCVLERVAPAALERKPFPNWDVEKIKNFFPYFIETYLTKKPLIPSRKQPPIPQPMYIAGSDDDIAYLIAGLTRCLPPQLLRDLTFSTYEQDVTSATTEIVGTCWISGRAKEAAGVNLLPPSYYQKKLALNCYTEDRTPLKGHPLVEDNPLAAQFAQDATEYLLYKTLGKAGSHEKQNILEEVFADACSYPNLDRATFFWLYQHASAPLALEDIATVLHISVGKNARQIPTVLQLSTGKNARQVSYAYSARMLSKTKYQVAILELVMYKPGWWNTTIREAFQKLLAVPDLAESLALLAQYALTRMVAFVKEADTSRERSADEVPAFKYLLELLQCLAPPEQRTTLWVSLFNQLVELGPVMEFFLQYWEEYNWLMQLWAQVLPSKDHRLARPLLILPWSKWGEFLTLRLTLLWNVIAIESLQATRLSEKGAAALKESHALILGLLEQLATTSPQDAMTPRYWAGALALFGSLAEARYYQKLQLLFLLLNSEMGKSVTHIKRVIQSANLTPIEIAAFLESYGARYLCVKDLAPQILKFYRELAKNDVDQAKMRLLFDWLGSPQLSVWLTVKENFVSLLETAHLTPEEEALFLEAYGETYIPLYPKLALLNAYVRRYVDNFFNADWQALGQHPPTRQTFVSFLLSTSFIQIPSVQAMRDWHAIGRFLNQPSLLAEDQAKVAACLQRLFNQPFVSSDMTQKLVEKLAFSLASCITDEFGLMSVVHTLYLVLEPMLLFRLFDAMAQYVRDAVHRGTYQKTHLRLYAQYMCSYQIVFPSRIIAALEKEHFLPHFLRVLLLGVDTKVLYWLRSDAQTWPVRARALWLQYGESLVPSVPVSLHQSPARVSLFRQFSSWWRSKLAYTSIRRAIHSKNIGTITASAIKNKHMLYTQQQEVIDWLRQIDAALTFVRACREAGQATEEDREIKEAAILRAAAYIRRQSELGYAMPKFTKNELRLIQDASQYLKERNTRRSQPLR